MPINALNKVISNLKATQSSIESVLDGFGVVVAERKRAELRVGLNADGKGITPIYSEPYLIYKSKLNTYQASSGTPDLYLSGDFARSIFATRKGFDYFFELKNAPIYANDIYKRYSEPSGISPQGEKDLDNKLRLRLEKELKKIWT